MASSKVEENIPDIRELPKNAEFMMTTNVANPITIQGVGEMDIRDSKGSKWRKSHVVLYKDCGVTKKAEINDHLYSALHLIFTTLNDLAPNRLFGADAMDSDYFAGFEVDDANYILPAGRKEIEGE